MALGVERHEEPPAAGVVTSTPRWLVTPATMAAELSRPTLEDGSRGDPEWWPALHLRLIALYLAAVAAGRIKRLAIFAPPRHGKSELTSRWFPLWALTLHPWWRIILSSYAGDYAAEHGGWVRDRVIRHGAELPGLELARDATAAGRWRTTAGGGMVSVGVGGQVTGRGANLLIVDDPVKDQADADSPSERRRVLKWWRGTIRTRLEPHAGVVLIMTRWHPDDLAGWLIAEQASRWTFLRLPALADDLDLHGREPAPDPLGRELGAPLWPDRWGVESMAMAQEESGLYVFSAQYQGLPVPSEGGGILSRERQAAALRAFEEAFPHGLDSDHLRRVVVAVDPPGGRTAAGIVVVGELAERGPDGRKRGLTLEDASLDRRPTPEQWAAQAIDAFYRWEANEIVAEVNYGGDMVKSTIRAIDATVPVRVVRATRGKRARAEPVAALFPTEGRPARMMRAAPMPRLVEEWATWRPDEGMESPNRLDAEVWGATALGLIVPPARKAKGPL